MLLVCLSRGHHGIDVYVSVFRTVLAGIWFVTRSLSLFRAVSLKFSLISICWEFESMWSSWKGGGNELLGVAS